jgi:hypothetical protein
MSEPIYFNVELTDTFGGQANYCWVDRHVIRVEKSANMSPRARQRLLMLKAKAAVGLTGVRGRTYNHGDMIEFRPYGLCQVMYVTRRDTSIHPIVEDESLES